MEKYILLREKNNLLNSLVGHSFNQKSKFEAEKILNEIHSIAQDRTINKKALCYVVDNSEIKGVGGSTLLKDKDGKIHSNLIMNNFGILLAALFKKFDTADIITTVKDIVNVDQTVRVYGDNATWTDNNAGALSIGAFVQIGSGITGPTRTDFALETAFGTAPESGNIVATTNPVFSSPNFKYLGSISAGGSGTINESVMTLGLRRSGGGARVDTLCFRDIISPAVGFSIGQSVALEYTVQI